jgi:Uma2 family endonuclease
MTTLSKGTTKLPASLIPPEWTMADVRAHLGGVPLGRIRSFPPPGMAREADALRGERVCELVDGILVEKPMGFYESTLAGLLLTAINVYLETNPIGIATGEKGPLWILPRRMRMPDVAFVRWDKFPGRRIPRKRTPRVAPDLAVEILSRGNTKAEMDLKLREYFKAGVRLVWYIDAKTRKARVYTSPTDVQRLGTNGVLDGRDVLPGFQLRLKDWFDKVPREED